MGVQKSAVADPKFSVLSAATLFDDFFNYSTGGLFTSLATGAGSSAADDTAGVDDLLCTTANSADDIQGVVTTKANFLPVADQGIWGVGVVKVSSVATRSAAIYFGFFSATPQAGQADAVPAASYSGAIIYALEGDTNWRTQSSNAGTKNNHTSTLPVVEGRYNELRIDIVNWDGLNAQVTYNVNGQTLMDSNYPNQPIVDKVAYASLVKMKLGAFVQRSHGTSGAQAASIDCLTASKARLSLAYSN